MLWSNAVSNYGTYRVMNPGSGADSRTDTAGWVPSLPGPGRQCAALRWDGAVRVTTPLIAGAAWRCRQTLRAAQPTRTSRRGPFPSAPGQRCSTPTPGTKGPHGGWGETRTAPHRAASAPRQVQPLRNE